MSFRNSSSTRPSAPGSAGPEDPTGPLGDATDAESLPTRLKTVYAKRTGPGEQALLLSWAAFTTTFGVVRGITHWLKRRDAGSGGSGGLVIGGRHLHHYNLGIMMLATVGGVAVHGQEHRRQHPATAIGYGVGAGLITDELALLLDLDDVYWGSDGRTSVDVAIGVVGIGGLVLAAVPFWRGALREVGRTRSSKH